MGIQHSVYTVEAGGGPWNILYENTDESKYSFDLNASAIGIKLVLYMSSRGDVNRDWVKIYVYSEVVNIYFNINYSTSEGEERTR